MKRFTDTALWEKQWFMELTPAEKIAWFYIKDACDHVGVWSPNFKLAEFIIGMQLDWEKFMKKTNGNIEKLKNGKWFMKDFCYFQYGELKETCKPHASYIKTLHKHGLANRLSKGYIKGMDTFKEKEKETDKEIEMDKEKEKEPPRTKYGEFENVLLTDIEYKKCIDKHGEDTTKKSIEKLSSYKASSGKKYKSDYATLNNWVFSEILKGKKQNKEGGMNIPKFDDDFRFTV